MGAGTPMQGQLPPLSYYQQQQQEGVSEDPGSGPSSHPPMPWDAFGLEGIQEAGMVLAPPPPPAFGGTGAGQEEQEEEQQQQGLLASIISKGRRYTEESKAREQVRAWVFGLFGGWVGAGVPEGTSA